MNVVGIEQTVRAQLTAPGAPFETAVEDVLGVPMRVFKHRARSLRELLIDSAKHGDAEYLVDGGNRISYIMLESWCRDTLATYKVPTRWEFRSQPLPRNPSGKILKGLLLGKDENRFDDGADSTSGAGTGGTK